MADETNELITTSQVAERFRTSESTVRYWRSIKYGPEGRRVGKRVLYSLAEVEAFWASLAEKA